MINIRTLDVLLRAFDAGAAAARPAAAVGAVGPASAVGVRIAPPDVSLLQPILDDVDPASLPAGRGDTPPAEANAARFAPAARARRSIAASGSAPVLGRDEAATSSDTTPDASAPLRLSGAARLVGELVR